MSKSIARINQHREYFLIIFTLVSITVLTPSIVLAAPWVINCPPNETYIATFDACLDFGTSLGLAITYGMILATLMAGVKFAVGAVRMIFSAGNPQKLSDARDDLTDAAIGLVLLATAFVLIRFLDATFPSEWNIQLFNLDLNNSGIQPVP